MTTFKPAADRPLILSFDGKVLEVFRPGEGLRYHVSLIEKLELKTDKKGNHTLDINMVWSYSNRDNVVDESAVAKVTSLIAEIEKAKAAFRFD